MAVQAGDVLTVTFLGELAGSTIMNTFHYGMDTVVGAPSQPAVAIELNAKLMAAFGLAETFTNCCPPAYVLDAIWIQFILNTRFRKSVFSATMPGTYAHDATTANLAGVITRHGPAANKRNVGSLHVPISNLDPDAVDGETSPNLNAALSALAAAVPGVITLATLGSCTPVFISGTDKGNAVPISGAFAQTTIRVMRRRTKGVGI